MSLNPQQKAAKDKARYQKHGGDKLLPKALRLLFATPTAGAGLRRRSIDTKLAPLTGKNGHLADTLIRQLVGQGFLQPAGAGYRLTAKGLDVIATGPSESTAAPE